MSVNAAFALASVIALTAQIYKPGDPGVQPPVVTKEVKAIYSASAMHDGVEGTVELEAVIDTRGRPREIRVVKLLERTLDENARAALGKWRFAPARKDGKPVDYRLQVSMTFDRRNGHRGPVCEKGDTTIVNPSVVKDVKPQYTVNAMTAKARGRVELEGIVETDGMVSSIRMTEGLHPDLNAASFAAFMAMRFKPATRGGVPIACRVTIEYTFNLR